MYAPASSRCPLSDLNTFPKSNAVRSFVLATNVNSPIGGDCGIAYMSSASRKALTPRPQKGSVRCVLEALRPANRMRLKSAKPSKARMFMKTQQISRFLGVLK